MELNLDLPFWLVVLLFLVLIMLFVIAARLKQQTTLLKAITLLFIKKEIVNKRELSYSELLNIADRQVDLYEFIYQDVSVTVNKTVTEMKGQRP